MAAALLVPCRVDALVVDADRRWLGETADFARLPYATDRGVVNADTPNVSEEVLAGPFAPGDFVLRRGVHLHWALPDALCEGTVSDDASPTVFAAVPNRWYIRRSRVDDGAAEAEWVVESDYLWPDGAGSDSGSATYPVAPNPAAGRSHPFRYLGRAVPLADWLADTGGDDYLDRLTCVGYGEPSFAALYPNCRGVFGFHDPLAGDARGVAGLTYDIVGWYSNADHDRFTEVANDIVAGLVQSGLAGADLAREFSVELANRFGWHLADTDAASIPTYSLYHSRVEFQVEPAPLDDVPAGPAVVALGNSAAEALVALVAERLAAAEGHGEAPNAIAEIEDQLGALNHADRLDHVTIDLGARFDEAVHDGGFRAVPGGRLWSVRPTRAEATEGDHRVALPAALAEHLNRVNELQAAYDSARGRLASLRHQLFADWYRYAVAAAATPTRSFGQRAAATDIATFVETADLSAIAEADTATGELHITIDPATGSAIGAKAAGDGGSVAARLADEIGALIGAVADLEQTIGIAHHLASRDAPRFWQPREPVVLVHGPAARATERHGRRHAGETLPVTASSAVGADGEDTMRSRRSDVMATLRSVSTAVAAAPTGPSPAVNRWETQPWHPFMLAWKVAVVPLLDSSSDEGYGADAISDAFALPMAACEMTRKPGALAPLTHRGTVPTETVYRGTTVLTPQATRTLRHRLVDALGKEMRRTGYLAKAYPGERAEELLTSRFDEVLAGFEQEHAARPTSALSRFIRAYHLLHEPGFAVLAQSLTGFNEALLMRKQTLQMPIAAPLAFAGTDTVSAKVAAVIGNSGTTAPMPATDFNPIRTGDLQLLRLQLIDTFGRRVDILDVAAAAGTPVPRIARTLQFNPAGSETTRISLPPRVVQPARLDFRWRSAGLGAIETNEHPATSPVCGWLVPNYLDNSVWVYESDGGTLGFLDQLGRWQPAPGPSSPVPVDAIADVHLRRLVGHLAGRDAAFLQEFISTLDAALQTIEPDSTAQRQARSLLMGRPIAVARASVGFSLSGAPAIHQGWHAFADDLAAGARHDERRTKRFEKVRFPIRLGDHTQLGDGLVGFWIEDGDRYRDDRFHSPQAKASRHPSIDTDGAVPPLFKSLDDPDDTVVLLIDPRAAIHARCGVLPSKSISVPSDHVVAALKAIQISFLTAPILTPPPLATGPEQLALRLPKEAGFGWSWIERRGDVWSEQPADLGGTADRPAPVGRQVLREGWLTLRPIEPDDEATTKEDR